MTAIDLTKPTAPPPPTPLTHHVGPRKPTTVDTTKPIRPEWQRDLATFRATARLFLHRNTYRARKQAFYLPVYVATLLAHAPLGFCRIVAALSRYLYDYDSAKVRAAHAGNTETAEYVKAQNVRRSNLKARWMVAGTLGVLVLVPVLAWTWPSALAVIVAAATFIWTVKLIPGKEMWELGVAAGIAWLVWWFTPTAAALIPQPPLWGVLSAAVAAVAALGWIGRPHGKTLGAAGRFAPPAALVKPTADMVIDALIAAVPGITEKTRDTIRPHAPGVARARHGYHLSLELPPGSTVSDVMENREPFAAALRRPLGCVWPSKGPMHPGHMKLFIGDEPMATAEQARWRLAEGKAVDVFNPLELFTDQEGAWVDVALMYNAIVVGGAPGYGKSFGLRAIGGAVALDPRTQIVVLDGKANGDMRPFRAVAHGYYEDDDEEGIAAQVKAVQDIRVEMRRRARFLRELPPAENPEDKVTSALVDRYPHLAPIFVIVDEVQVYTENDDKKVREAFIAAMADIVRRGRSAGIVPVLCTQKPSADVLPTAITDNCSVRLCFKVNGQRANDAVLGTEMHSSGIKATKFGPDDRGLAWLKGDGAEPRVVRTVYGLDKPASEALMAKARALREARGLLTGYAAGEDTAEPVVEVDLLADVRDVMDHPPVPTMHLAELREALTLLRPTTWGHLDNAALGGMLRAAGVEPRTVWSRSAGKDGKGVKRTWLDEGGATVHPISGA